MFSSKNNTPKDHSNTFLGKEFIHTMKDDLNPFAKADTVAPSSVSNPSPFGSITPPQPPYPKNETSSQANIASSINSSVLEKPNKTQTLLNIPQKKNPVILEKEEDIFADKESRQSRKGSLLKVFVIIISILVIIMFLAGAYYYWMINKKPSEESVILPVDNITGLEEKELNRDEEGLITISPLSEKYSSEKPNYLSVNVETMSAEEIKKYISDTAKEVSVLQSKTPFEFIITDSNNNPVAFPMFATFSNINIAPEVLLNLEENFSFYVYDDQGKTRTGLAINVKDKTLLLTEMQKAEEKGLVNSLSFMFIYESFSSKNIPFRNNIYSGVPVRYLNLNTEDSISIDYGVYNEKLIIATSKNTFRAIVDKIISQKINLNSASQSTGKLQEQSTP